MKTVFRFVSVLIVFSLLLGTVSFAMEATEPDYIFISFCDEDTVTEYVDILKDDNEENGGIYGVEDASIRNTSGGFGLFLHIAEAVSPTVTIKIDDDIDLSKYPYARICISYNQQTAYTGSFDAWIKCDGAAEASKLATVISSGTSKEVRNKDGVSCGQRGIFRRSYSFLSFVTGAMETVANSHKLVFSPSDAGENAVNSDVIIKYMGLFKTEEDAQNFDPSVKGVAYENNGKKFAAELDFFNHTASIDFPDGEVTPDTVSAENLEITLLDGRCSKTESDISDAFNMKYEIQSLEQKQEANEQKKEIWTVKITCVQIDDTYKNNLLARLNSLTIDNSSGLIDDFDRGLSKLVTGYDGLTAAEKLNLAQILTSYAGEFTLANYIDTISGELFYAKIRACEDANDFENLIDGTEFKASATCKIFFNDITDEERETVFAVSKKELSFKNFCDELIKKSLLTGVSMKEGYGTVKELFEDNLLVIGYADRNAYDTVCEKTDNLVNAYKLLTLHNFASVEELKTSFENAVETIGKSTSEQDSGSGSGNGGGAAITNAKPSNISVPVQNKPANGGKGGFADLGGYEWAQSSIENLYEKGVISGKGEGNFAPGDTVTREEFIQMIVKAFDITAESDVEFSDVEADKWYYDAISKAVGAGIISGVSAQEFGTGKSIIRQDMAVIAENVLKFIGNIDDEKEKSEFNDDTEISDYAKKAVATLADMGIINGSDGKFEPKRNMTRAEAAIIVTALMNLQK